MFTLFQTALAFKKIIRLAWGARVAYLFIKISMNENKVEEYKRLAWNATKYLIFMELIFRISYLVQKYYGR